MAEMAPEARADMEEVDETEEQREEWNSSAELNKRQVIHESREEEAGIEEAGIEEIGGSDNQAQQESSSEHYDSESQLNTTDTRIRDIQQQVNRNSSQEEDIDPQNAKLDVESVVQQNKELLELLAQSLQVAEQKDRFLVVT